MTARSSKSKTVRLVPRSKACRGYVRISDTTPKARSRLNARRVTAGSPTSRWTETSPRPLRCTLPAEWKSPESSARRSHSLRGVIAASSCRRSSESDTFEQQQSLLVTGPEGAVGPQAVRGDHAVAGDHDAEAVTCAERSCRALRPRVAGEPCEITVGDHLSVRDAPQGADDVELERRPPFELELDVVERRPLSGEVGLEPLDQFVRFRRTLVAHARTFRR